jgi:hypothetical protein
VFAGPPAEAAAARISRDPDVPTDLPGPWPVVLRAMTARDPALRPSAAAVHDRLGDDGTQTAPAVTAPLAGAGFGAADATVQAAPAGTEVAPTSARELPRQQRRRRWGKAAVVAALLAVALVAGALVYAATSDSGSSPPATTTTVAPTTVAPPTTLPPPTAPPPPVKPDNHGNGNGKGSGKESAGEQLQREFQARLDQLRQLLERQGGQGG